MSLKNRILAQARLISGELDAKQAALLEVLCSAASDSLKVRLKAQTMPEDCAAEFVTAASLYAIADLRDADDSVSVEEFRAGDLTVKKGSRGNAASRSLREQADKVIGPYLAAPFSFTGV